MSQKISANKKRSSLARQAKESKEARKQRASSGVRFRAVAMGDKKRKRLDKLGYDEE